MINFFHNVKKADMSPLIIYINNSNIDVTDVRAEVLIYLDQVTSPETPFKNLNRSPI